MDLEGRRLELLPGVAERLGHYVYALVDPRSDTVFYVGKGVGHRAYAHAREARLPGESRSTAKLDVIKKIREEGREVGVEIVRHGLESEEVALIVEGAVIDALRRCGHGDLHNVVRGHGSTDRGWTRIDGLAHLAAERIEIPDWMRPALLIRPRVQYRDGMSEEQLREITRKQWKVKLRDYRYLFCVHKGVIQGVWEVLGEDKSEEFDPGRRGFRVKPAPEAIWDKVYGKSVKPLPQGAQTPFSVLT